MNIATARAGTEDFHAVAALSALRKIAEHTGQLGKLVREDWRDYGYQLLTKREEFGSNDKAFGKWVKDNGLDAPPAQTAGVRSDAMWLAKHWERVAEFYLVPAYKDDDHHPHHIRTACRVAGCAWAFEQTKAEGTTSKVGWMEIVYRGTNGVLRSTLLHNNKKAIESELGEKFGSHIHADCELAQRVIAAAQRWYDKVHQNSARTRIEIGIDAVAEEVLTLPEKAQAKFDRLVEKQRKLMEQRIPLEVERRVVIELDKRMAAERKRIANEDASAAIALKSANERMREAELRMKTFDAWMTLDEFKLVLGCLHPDRQPEDQRQKYDKAFQIFKRLEQHMTPNSRTLKNNGWERR